MALTPGHRLGPFEIIRLLGSGGMGSVYLAYDTRLDRRVAVKILRDPAGAETARRLTREARAAARLAHPNIAALYDLVEHDGALLLVMEYVEGESLGDIVARGPLDPMRVVDIGIELADALSHAHREGIIHADVKPANIVIARDGRVKLLDLGIARVTAIDPAGPTRTGGDVGTGPGPGTPAYMAPEQLGGHNADARSDIYSSGVLLFEVLTGRRPFHAKDWLELAVAVSKETPRVKRLRPGVPAALDAIIARAMARDPSARYATADDLRDDLVRLRDAFRTGEPLPVARRVPHKLIAAIVVVAALGAAGLWYSMRPRPSAVAVLPAISLGADPLVSELGAGLVAIVTDNLAGAPGLSVSSPAAVAGYRGLARDRQKIARDLGAGYVVDLSLQRSGTDAFTVDGQLVKAGQPEPLWKASLTGNALEVHEKLLEALAAALERAGVFSRALSADERQRIRQLPTRDTNALTGYARAASLLDRAGDAAGATAAVAAFETAIASDPAFALAHAGLSQACVLMYSFTSEKPWIDRATRSARAALDLDASRAPAHIALARVLLTTGDYEQAQAEALKAVELSPDSDDAHRMLARAMTERSRYDEAIAEIDKAIRLRPDYWSNHYEKGYIFVRAARYADAVEPFRRVTQLNPNYADGYTSLGTVLHYAGDLDGAIGNYEHALRLGDDAFAYANLAFSYYAAGKFDKALDNYKKSIAKDASRSVLYRNLGDTYARLGDGLNAKSAYEQGLARGEADLKVNRNDAALIAHVAMCEAKLGRPADALRHAREAFALGGKDNDVVYKLAVVQALTGDSAAAIATLKSAIALGYPVSFARQDFDLESLKGLPEFTSIVGAGR